MLRVLLINDTEKPISQLGEVLVKLGYEVFPVVVSARELSEAVKQQRPDMIIVDTESPSRDTLEHLALMHCDAPRPAVTFGHDADQQLLHASVGAGVTVYVVDGIEPARLTPILEVALTLFAEGALARQRLAEVEAELADRRLIDCAKGILMDKRKLDEAQAYATLRKLSMNQGIKIADVARQIIAIADRITQKDFDDSQH